MNTIFLIVGAPAVGKSTTSKALAARFPKSIHIPVDDLRTMVVSGLMLPSAEWSDGLVEQIRLARQSAVHMAFAYRDAGFTVVIDDFWDGNHSTDYHALWNEANFQRVLLYPSQVQAHAQNAQRSGDSPARPYIDEGIEIVYGQINAVAHQLESLGWRVVNSTGMSVECVVETILEPTR